MIETIIYLVISCLLGAYHRVLGGMKNACFYAKGSNPIPPLLDKYVKNLHYIETPSWYSQFGSMFFMCFAIFRLVDPTVEFWVIFREFWAAMFITMGSSGMASYFYQGYINVSAGKPFMDPNENPKSEFAFGPIRFWWPRPWGGRFRQYTPFIGTIDLIIGIYLGLFK